MDPTAIMQLGVTATLIFAVAAVVNPTVNQFKSALLLDSKQTLLLAYGLSFLLTIILALINPIDGTLPLYALVAKTLVAGWAAAVHAGNMADAQRKTDEKMRAYGEEPPAFLPPHR